MPDTRSTPSTLPEGQRLAKVIARSGICSRRDAEKLILAGKVTVDEKPVITPAFNVTGQQRIRVNGKPIPKQQTTQLYRFYKPKGVLTTRRDPKGRKTIYDLLPARLSGFVYVGRLDYNSEGLLLLTNDGTLSRHLELPTTALARTYRARAHGTIDQHKLARIKKGITLDRIRYAPATITIEHEGSTNHWLTVTVREGKNHEVRNLLEFAGLTVNRLIRTQYGSVHLDKMEPGMFEKIEPLPHDMQAFLNSIS